MVRVYERAESSSWYAEIEVGGVLKRRSTNVPKGARNKRKAEQAALALQVEANRVECGGTTFKRAVVQYLEESTLVDNTLRSYNIYFVNLLRDHPNLMLREITPTFLRDFITTSKANKRPDPSIRQALAAYSSLLTAAIDGGWPGAPEVNPVKLVSKKRVTVRKKDKRNWLLPEEVRDILAVAPDVFWKPFLRLLLETGMRHQELLGLLWSEVDVTAGAVTLPAERTKGAKRRIVPLTQAGLSTVLTQSGDTSHARVFINKRTRKPYGSIYYMWGKIRTAAGYPDATLHQLRHTFASWTRQSGLSKDDRMAIMGHSSETQQDHYAHTRIDLLRKALEVHSPSTILAQFELTEGTQATVQLDEAA